MIKNDINENKKINALTKKAFKRNDINQMTYYKRGIYNNCYLINYNANKAKNKSQIINSFNKKDILLINNKTLISRKENQYKTIN